MSMFGFLLTWYNTPFIAALGCCLVFALLQLIGGFGDQDADLDSDVDIDADADVDGGLFEDALSMLGIGRVPLTLVLMVFLGCFGAAGLLLNSVAVNVFGGYPSIALWLVLSGSLFIAVLLTNRISRWLGKLAPDTTTAISFEQLVGRVGVVVSPSISSTYGRVQVRDNFGSLHTVFAVIAGDEPIRERNEVALIGYDATKRCFLVQPLDRVRTT